MAAALKLAAPLTWPATLDFVMAQQGLTDRSLARELGLAHMTIYRCRNGSKPKARTLELLEDWAVARGIDPGWLFRASADDGGELHDLSSARAARSRSRGGKGSGGSGRGGDGTNPPHQDDEMQILTREYLTQEELDHFQLGDDPFEDAVTPDELFLPKDLARIEGQMVRAIRGRKIFALTGPPGSGKSALLRRVWARAAQEKRIRLIAPALMDRRRVTVNTLTVAILRDLLGRDTTSMGAESRAQLLRTTLADQVEGGQYATLFLDEAHDMRDDALIAIKRLWDSHVLFRQLAVVMVGQPPLAGRLRSDTAIAELAGRTQLVELPAFSPDAVHAYLAWRFARVGAEVDATFDPLAVRAIAARADRPLWINNVCVMAMRQARTIGDTRVVTHHVGRV